MSKEYFPPNGAVHTAKEGLRLVAEGKVSEGGVAVDVPDYSEKIANAQPVGIQDVSKIVSHLLTNVSNRKKGWDEPENLSNSRINWQLQGGCQAFEWSHKAVAEAIESGDIVAEDIPGYITPEEFSARGGCY
jgi:hypothetical protein